MRKIIFIFSIIATLLGGTNLYAQTVEEVVFTITNKEVVGGSGSRPWLELSGKHETLGKLYLEVNAINSYDIPVHIIYDPTLTALPNIHSPISNTHKYIRGGQLIIRKDKHEYNAQGIQIQ